MSRFESSTESTGIIKQQSSTRSVAVMRKTNRPQPQQTVKKTTKTNDIQLTSGMPEEKAALLIRKFFVNELSVLEPAKKSRLIHPCSETIAEESSNSDPSEVPTS